MEVVVKYLGMLSEEIQCEMETITIDKDETIDSLDEKLKNKHPKLATKTYRIAVNHQLSSLDSEIKSGSEIALLPAFAGG